MINQKDENESKFLLTIYEFEELLDYYDLKKITPQLNVYYDDNFKLADIDSTFRFRFTEDEDPLLTLKILKSWDTDTRKAIEIEMLVKEAIHSLYLRSFHRRELHPKLDGALSFLGIDVLRRLGCMRNRRYLLGIDNELKFELDCFRLPGNQECYEVEVEEDDPEKRITIVNKIKQITPDIVPSKISKFKRFVEAVKAGS